MACRYVCESGCVLVQILLNIRSLWSILLSELSQNDRPCGPMQPPAHVIGPRYGMQPVPCVSAVNISPGTCTGVRVLFMRRPCLSIPLTLMIGVSLRRRCALGEHVTKDFARFVWTPTRERLTVRASVACSVFSSQLQGGVYCDRIVSQNKRHTLGHGRMQE